METKIEKLENGSYKVSGDIMSDNEYLDADNYFEVVISPETLAEFNHYASSLVSTDPNIMGILLFDKCGVETGHYDVYRPADGIDFAYEGSDEPELDYFQVGSKSFKLTGFTKNSSEYIWTETIYLSQFEEQAD
jgi:hypothetical protein